MGRHELNERKATIALYSYRCIRISLSSSLFLLVLLNDLLLSLSTVFPLFFCWIL